MLIDFWLKLFEPRIELGTSRERGARDNQLLEYPSFFMLLPTEKHTNTQHSNHEKFCKTPLFMETAPPKIPGLSGWFSICDSIQWPGRRKFIRSLSALQLSYASWLFCLLFQLFFATNLRCSKSPKKRFFPMLIRLKLFEPRIELGTSRV